jgi:aspartokinase-like uncharacterized kinase
MNVVVLSEVFNKRKELKSKVVRITNKVAKKCITLATMNEIYNELLEKYKPEQIFITGLNLDNNIRTIKSKGFTGTNLKHADESYWSSQPKAIKDKFIDRYYSVDITIMI